MVKDEKKGDKVAVAVKAIKSIEELSGVGPATAEKLKEAGFTDLMGLAVASPTMVADAAEIGTNVAQKIIIAAREAVDIGGFETGDNHFFARYEATAGPRVSRNYRLTRKVTAPEILAQKRRDLRVERAFVKPVHCRFSTVC